MFRFLVYVSAATARFTEAELRAMLIRFRERNEASGITGMLLYHDGDFIQLLEGPEAIVGGVMDRIERDPRHTRVIRLLEGSAQERSFAGWSMGFHMLNPSEAPEGFSSFLYSRQQMHENPAAVHRLLMSFRDSRRAA